ncbi:hypothetical protein ACP70R_032388 [Stipagrostis hirtigluma subsp. patula]
MELEDQLSLNAYREIPMYSPHVWDYGLHDPEELLEYSTEGAPSTGVDAEVAPPVGNAGSAPPTIGVQIQPCAQPETPSLQGVDGGVTQRVVSGLLRVVAAANNASLLDRMRSRSQLSEKERRKKKELSDGEIQRVFAHFDKDSDGRISAKELSLFNNYDKEDPSEMKRRWSITSPSNTETRGGYWKDKHQFTAIRGGPEGSEQYIGAKKTYQFHKRDGGTKSKADKTWLMNEYYLLQPHRDRHGLVIQEDIVLREVFSKDDICDVWNTVMLRKAIKHDLETVGNLEPPTANQEFGSTLSRYITNMMSWCMQCATIVTGFYVRHPRSMAHKPSIVTMTNARHQFVQAPAAELKLVAFLPFYRATLMVSNFAGQQPYSLIFSS